MSFNQNESFQLSTAGDVGLNNPLDAQVIAYNSGIAKWQNANISSTYALQPRNNARAVGQGELVINVNDFRSPGDVDDAPAIAAAHTAADVVTYPTMTAPGASKNLYGSYTNALGTRMMAGRSGIPITDARPVLWVQKHSASNRAVNAGEWDQGAFYGSLIKESGDAYGAAITGFARHESSDGGQLIGGHFRGAAYKAESEVWGLWAYAYNSNPGIIPHSVIGQEINLNVKNVDQGWMVGGGVGASRGLVVVTQDNSNQITHGIYVGNGSNAPNGQMHTGILLKGSGIVPADAAISSSSVANNEALRIEGAAVIADAYTAIRLRSGRFRTGLSLAEATYDNNAAILLADQQRIVIGDGPGSSRYIGFDTTTATANFNNLNIAVNGLRLLGTRKAGWGTPTGIVSRTAFDPATVTLPELAQRLAGLITDLKTHGLIGD
jgi:hypothetical protein